MIILRLSLCSPCLIRTSSGSFFCFGHVVTIAGRFRSVFWGVPLLYPCLIPPLWDGIFLLMEPFLARLLCHTSFHAVITYSHALFHLDFAPGFCLVPLRPTHPASIDGLSLRICRFAVQIFSINAPQNSDVNAMAAAGPFLCCTSNSSRPPFPRDQ